MPSFAVKVKWNRTVHEVTADTDDKPSTFKGQIFALTGVPPERQKVMFKARQLPDDDWSKFEPHLKDGVTITMMGNADAVPQAITAADIVKKAPEDLTEEEKRALVKPPAGLKNLGNTCYMNATLQCLKAVPEFSQALEKYPVTLQRAMTSQMGEMNPPQALTASMRDLFRLMNANEEVAPLIFLQLMHTALPQMAGRDDHGHPQQQDAGECWTELLRFLHSAKLPSVEGGETSTAEGQDNWVTKYFGGKMACELKCKEAEDEPMQPSTEDFLTFSCYINTDVKYLSSGLKAKLTEELTKHCASLGRDAVWEKKSLLTRLPAYLTITIMRFFYKEKERTNAKILKDIKYPFELDLIDMCTDELKNKVLPHRNVMQHEEDAKMDRLTRIKSGDLEEKTIKSWPVTKLPYSFSDDPGSNCTAMYDLQAVLTHKGRSSNVGHYVAWVRVENAWFCCDDDNVYPVTAEDIERLSGGGDWHTAYVLLYAPKVVTVINEPQKAAGTNGTTTVTEMETDK